MSEPRAVRIRFSFETAGTAQAARKVVQQFESELVRSFQKIGGRLDFSPALRKGAESIAKSYERAADRSIRAINRIGAAQTRLVNDLERQVLGRVNASIGTAIPRITGRTSDPTLAAINARLARFHTDAVGLLRQIAGRGTSSRIGLGDVAAMAVSPSLIGRAAPNLAAQMNAMESIPGVPKVRGKNWKTHALAEAAAHPSAPTTGPAFTAAVQSRFDAEREALKTLGGKRGSEISTLSSQAAKLLGGRVQVHEQDEARARLAIASITKGMTAAGKRLPGLADLLAKSGGLSLDVHSGNSFEASYINDVGRRVRGPLQGRYSRTSKLIELASGAATPSTFLHELGHAAFHRLGREKQSDWTKLYSSLPNAATGKRLKQVSREAFAESFAKHILGSQFASSHPDKDSPELKAIFGKNGALLGRLRGFMTQEFGGDDGDAMPARRRRYSSYTTPELFGMYEQMVDSYTSRAKGGSDVRAAENVLNHLRRTVAKGGRKSKLYGRILGVVEPNIGRGYSITEDEAASILAGAAPSAKGSALGRWNRQYGEHSYRSYATSMGRGGREVTHLSDIADSEARFLYAMAESKRLGRFRGNSTNHWQGVQAMDQKLRAMLSAPFRAVGRLFSRGGDGDAMPVGASNVRTGGDIFRVPGASAISSVIKFGAGIWAIERAFRALKSISVDPFSGFVRSITAATEESRKFEYSIAGQLGSVGRAADVNRLLTRASRNSPSTLADIRDSASAMSRSPALSGRMVFADSPAAAAANVMHYNALVARMAVLDPAQGFSGSRIAINELTEGGDWASFSSIRRRFGISGRALAGQLGGRFPSSTDAREAMMSDSTLGLEALENIVNSLIPQSAADRMGKLLSVRVEKIKETYRDALRSIGDSGLYDQLANRAESFGSALFQHFDSPEFREQARRISDSLGRILDNVGKLIVNFLRRITGSTDDASTVAGVTGLVAGALDRIAALSESLPALGNNIGGFIHGLGGVVDKAIGKVDELIASISGFSLAQNLVDPMRMATWKDGGASLSEARARMTVDLAKQYGIEGVKTKEVDLDPWTANSSAGDDFAKMGKGFKHAIYRYLASSDDWEAARKAGYRYANGTVTDIDLSGVKDNAQSKLVADLSRAVQGLDPRSFDDATRASLAVNSAINGIPGLRDRLAAFGKGQKPDPVFAGPSTRPIMPDYAADYVPKLRAIIAREEGGPNFAAQSLAAGQRTANVESGVPESAWRRATRTGSGLMSAGLGGSKDGVTLGNVLSRMRGMYDKQDAEFLSAISEGRAAIAGQVSPDKDVTAWIGQVEKYRAEMRKGFEAASGMIRDNLLDAAREHGEALNQALGELPPETAALLHERISAGATSLGRQVEAALKSAGMAVPGGARAAYGIDSLPLDRRLALSATDAGRRLESVRAASRFGVLTDQFGAMRTDLSADAIMSASPLYEADNAERVRRLIEMKSLPEARGLFDEARAAYLANPDDERTAADLGIAGRNLAETSAQLREVRRSLDYAGEGWKAFGVDARQALDSSLGQALSDIILQTGNAGEAFKAFARDVIGSFSRMSANNITHALFGNAGRVDQQGNQAGFGGLVSGLGSILGSLFGSTSNVATAAHGGIWQGGFQAFARGGVTSGPLLGLVGEGGRREAMVPMRGNRIPTSNRGGRVFADLPDGKAIATDAIVGGGGGREVNVYPVIVRSEAEADAVEASIRSRDVNAIVQRVKNEVADDFRRGGPISKTSKRKG